MASGNFSSAITYFDVSEGDIAAKMLRRRDTVSSSDSDLGRKTALDLVFGLVPSVVVFVHRPPSLGVAMLDLVRVRTSATGNSLSRDSASPLKHTIPDVNGQGFIGLRRFASAGRPAGAGHGNVRLVESGKPKVTIAATLLLVEACDARRLLVSRQAAEKIPLIS